MYGLPNIINTQVFFYMKNLFFFSYKTIIQIKGVAQP